jgi:hypothetical protein
LARSPPQPSLSPHAATPVANADGHDQGSENTFAVFGDIPNGVDEIASSTTI